MLPLWDRLSSELHLLIGLLDDIGDISSALVITLATLKVAVAFLRKRTRRASAACTLSHPRRRRRRHRRAPCVNRHPTTASFQRCESHTPRSVRCKAARSAPPGKAVSHALVRSDDTPLPHEGAIPR
jgi:hypothetical protein